MHLFGRKLQQYFQKIRWIFKKDPPTFAGALLDTRTELLRSTLHWC